MTYAIFNLLVNLIKSYAKIPRNFIHAKLLNTHTKQILILKIYLIRQSIHILLSCLNFTDFREIIKLSCGVKFGFYLVSFAAQFKANYIRVQ